MPDRTKLPTITIQVSPEDFDIIHRFAYVSKTSVAQVMKIGIFRLMADAEAGEVPLLPEFRPGFRPDA